MQKKMEQPEKLLKESKVGVIVPDCNRYYNAQLKKKCVIFVRIKKSIQ